MSSKVSEHLKESNYYLFEIFIFFRLLPSVFWYKIKYVLFHIIKLLNFVNILRRTLTLRYKLNIVIKCCRKLPYLIITSKCVCVCCHLVILQLYIVKHYVTRLFAVYCHLVIQTLVHKKTQFDLLFELF